MTLPIVVTILGTDYRITEHSKDEDEMLKTADGYTDKTSHKIVIDALNDRDVSFVDRVDQYKQQILRHEIIHAFLFESGLSGNANYQTEGQEHPEMLIDWFAIQYPKIKKAFEEAGCAE